MKIKILVCIFLLLFLKHTEVSQAAINETQKLFSNDGEENDFFGYSVSISGNTAIIGAYNDDDDNGSSSGSIYIFNKVNDIWTQTAKLIARDGASTDLFGKSVAILGDIIIAGSPNNDDNGTNSGAAYIFEKIEGTWTQTAKLLASDGYDNDVFGYSVAIFENTAVIGAVQDGDMGTWAGSAYIFEKVDGTWTEITKILAGDGTNGDAFSVSVSISENTVIIGASGDDSYKGSAYIFEKVVDTWSQTIKLTASDGIAGDCFGYAVSISGDTAIIGASKDCDNGDDAGSAYIFKKINNSWVENEKLLASDGAASDNFGEIVSISEGNVIVGAPKNDDNGDDSGSAYFFKKVNENWIQIAKLLASDGATDDNFGCSVSISGKTAIIGAYGNDNNATSTGSAYIFGNKTFLLIDNWMLY